MRIPKRILASARFHLSVKARMTRMVDTTTRPDDVRAQKAPPVDAKAHTHTHVHAPGRADNDAPPRPASEPATRTPFGFKAPPGPRTDASKPIEMSEPLAASSPAEPAAPEDGEPAAPTMSAPPILRQYELVERVLQYNPKADEALLNRAYVYAMKAHGHQKRASGAPYFSHPIAVAAILTELHLDDATIAAALLHDTIEDTDTTRDELEGIFGRDIAELVEGLTKIGQLDLVSKKAEQAENLRKLLLAIATDARVLLIKLADRLHNMRTLGFMKPHKRERIAQETLDIYAPLAGRMGMQTLRDELEDLSFEALHPDGRRHILERLERLRSRNKAVIAEIRDDLTERLTARGINARVLGREKRPYAIWRKIQRKAIGFEQLSDIVGFRIVVDDVAACYQVLGLVHTAWAVVPGRFKDYISTPKQNDYRSIHTTVIDSHRQRVELQIRTREMDEIAEYGIAAHVLYKEGEMRSAGGTGLMPNGLHGGVKRSGDGFAYANLRRTIDLLAEGSSAEEFLEHAKLELFQDQVFCFTPKGRVIALPRGATPLDFAYAVHTDVGNGYVGAKINGRLATINSILNNGDEVEVLVSEKQEPLTAWESIVTTGKAKAAIRRATRNAARAQFTQIGRGLLERHFARAGKTYSDDALEPVLRRLNRPSLEDALISVGRAEMHPQDVLLAVHPDYQAEETERPRGPDEGWFSLRGHAGLKFRFADAENEDGAGVVPVLPVRGFNRDVEIRFAAGGAVPGDRIVGIVEDDAVVIHPIHSPDLARHYDEPHRWLDLRWDMEDGAVRFPAQILVTAENKPGALAEIAEAIGDSDANIDNMRMTNRMTGCHEMAVDLEVWNLRHLNTLLGRLRTLHTVSEARRVEAGE